MKLAVSAGGDSLDSPFEPSFGRAPGFVVYDTGTGRAAYLDNSVNQGLTQGAGIKAARMIAGSGAQVLLTGSVGPKASQALAAGNVEIRQVDGGTVREAIQAFQDGLLQGSGSGPRSGISDRSVSGRGLGGRHRTSGGRGSGSGGGRGMEGDGGQGMGGRGMGGGRRGSGGQGGGRKSG